MRYFAPSESMLIALKLKLDALGITPEDYYNSDREGKRKIQGTLYLAQELGTNLNLRYQWYQGVYSPDLADELHELYISGIDTDKYELSTKYKWAIKKAVQLKEADPRRLAIYHFLRKHSRVNHDKAVEVMSNMNEDYDDSLVEYLKVYKLWDTNWDSHKTHVRTY